MASNPVSAHAPTSPDCVTGAILAGGLSSRLGFPKARLRLGSGRELIDDLTRKLALTCADVLIAGGGPSAFGGRLARLTVDAWPATGALGGIHTALANSRCEWTLVVACDLPFLQLAVMRALIKLRSDDFDAVVPRLRGEWEPTHALYSRRCLPKVESALKRGDLKVAHVFSRMRVLPVEESELRSVDPELLSFTNVNTPAELARALRLVDERGTALLTS